MAHDWTVRAVALAELRRRYGVTADPETHPAWPDMLAMVEDEVNDLYNEEGGEG
jgi:hypothetical protein